MEQTICLLREKYGGDTLTLGYEQTERQRQAAAAAAPMLVYGDATHDAWKGSQTHSLNLP